MKNLVLLLLFMAVMIFSGCSRNTITSPNNNKTSTGKVSLKIDKTNAPQNVATVIAYLIKAGSDTLTGSLNLRSDSTADISFQNIPVGTWHLLVNAEDGNGVVVYSGQSDVEVVEGTTTSVSLTLVPTISGTGSIYIYVTWGTLNTAWSDYPDNPVLVNNSNVWGPYGIGNPKILIDSNEVKMWFKYMDYNGLSYVGYATSKDGIEWSINSSGPVLLPGDSTSWDAGAVSPGAVIKDNGIYKMFYFGAHDPHQAWSIGLATSTDGIHWTKYPNPIIKPENWEYSIGTDEVIKVNNIYYIYYSNYNPSFGYGMSVATSSDGINWTKYSGNPILVANQPWEGIGAYYSTVIYENGLFKMVYMNYKDGDFGFGKATSSDGFNWIKSPNNPFFTKINASNNWTQKPIFPCLRKFGNTYRVYYNADDYKGITNNEAIGFLTINNF